MLRRFVFLPFSAAPVLSAMAVVLSAPAVSAQSSSERTMAEALFRQARELMADERFDEACPKFAESQRLDPGGGTLLNLAVCHEQQGKLATAWAEYQEALAQARADGREDRIKLAGERIDEIEPKLARLKVTVEGQPPAGLAVVVNGTPLGAAGWGTPMPVDAGTLRIEASAPGREPFSQELEISDGQALSLSVPVLPQVSSATGQDMASESAPASATETDATAAYITGGIGLATLALGSYFGVRALQEHATADDHCSDTECDSIGRKADEAAVFNGWLSTISLGVGLAAMGVAIYLYPTDDAANVHDAVGGRGLSAAPVVGRGSAGVDVVWRY